MGACHGAVCVSPPASGSPLGTAAVSSPCSGATPPSAGPQPSRALTLVLHLLLLKELNRSSPSGHHPTTATPTLYSSTCLLLQHFIVVYMPTFIGHIKLKALFSSCKCWINDYLFTKYFLMLVLLTFLFSCHLSPSPAVLQCGAIVDRKSVV